jgi:hypothetical protein
MHCIPGQKERSNHAPEVTSRVCRRGALPIILGALALIVLVAVEMPSLAQNPSQPRFPAQPDVPGVAAQQAPADTGQANGAQPSQSQLDKEWLTAYFMAHEGYKLQHMPALEATLGKMTPTQLHTLRDMYDKKHSMMMQQQQIFNQWNAQKLAQAQAWSQRQQQQMNQISAEESQSASLEERQINQMHQEAAANAEIKNQSYPGMYGPYGGPYGGGYIHPYFNPLGANPY